jgi:Protein of unknown function (DUF3306)
MTEAENPISRWSRLKLAAEKARKILPAAGAPSPHAVETGATDETDPTAASRRTDAPASRTFDPASLPPIDSIVAGTDIRAFLQSGVPATLARAALRRAWVSEPGIRDFIGIAENQWDFTDPTVIPGFGPLLETDDIPRLFAQALGTFDKSSATFEDTTVSAEEALPATHDFQCGTVDTVVRQTGHAFAVDAGSAGILGSVETRKAGEAASASRGRRGIRSPRIMPGSSAGSWQTWRATALWPRQSGSCAFRGASCTLDRTFLLRSGVRRFSRLLRARRHGWPDFHRDRNRGLHARSVSGSDRKAGADYARFYHGEFRSHPDRCRSRGCSRPFLGGIVCDSVHQAQRPTLSAGRAAHAPR